MCVKSNPVCIRLTTFVSHVQDDANKEGDFYHVFNIPKISPSIDKDILTAITCVVHSHLHANYTPAGDYSSPVRFEIGNKIEGSLDFLRESMKKVWAESMKKLLVLNI